MVASPGSIALSLLVGVGGLLGTGALATGLGWMAQTASSWFGL